MFWVDSSKLDEGSFLLSKPVYRTEQNSCSRHNRFFIHSRKVTIFSFLLFFFLSLSLSLSLCLSLFLLTHLFWIRPALTTCILVCLFQWTFQELKHLHMKVCVSLCPCVSQCNSKSTAPVSAIKKEKDTSDDNLTCCYRTLWVLKWYRE